MVENKFSFVIARPWHEFIPDNLCIYMYGHEIHNGTTNDAKELLEYVRRNYKDTSYSIYKVNFEKVVI